MSVQLDLFTPAPRPTRAPRIGDCLLCWGERYCEDLDMCFPEDGAPDEG